MGFGLFVFQDELINAAAGLSGNPKDYPWQAHARGLVAHLVYGLMTDVAFSAMKAEALGRRAVFRLRIGTGRDNAPASEVTISRAKGFPFKRFFPLLLSR